MTNDTTALPELPDLDAAHAELAFEVCRNINIVNFIDAELICERDQRDPAGRLYYQIKCMRRDTYTGEPGLGGGGKAYLSPTAIESELVRTGIALLLAYVEHEAREAFEYKGVKVFNPHISIDALLVAATQVEFRPNPPQEDQ